MFSYEIPPQVREINEPVYFTLNEFTERSLTAFDRALHKAKESRQPIFPIKIQSDGGSVAIMLGFMSLMKKYRQEGIQFISSVVGTAASAGCCIFLYCDRRFMGEFASILFHSSQIGIEGPLPSVKSKIDWYDEEEKKINEILSKHLKKPKGWIEGQLKKRGPSEDWLIRAEEAKAMNLATDIGMPTLTLVVDAGFMIS